jgi:glutamyl-Q tRNA(Asp) synthetase
MSKPLSIGRFAPSPTGPLHFGSLIAAVSSYLNVKQQHGKWLVRIEDIDPPREVSGASDHILRQLEQHGLAWDDQIVYQSSRTERYLEVLEQLQQQGLIYHCNCNRQRLVKLDGIYDGKCRKLALEPQNTSIRLAINACQASLKPATSKIGFHDGIMGSFCQHPQRDIGDFILRRRDELFSYQLAVVVDDNDQGVTQVVRGADLLESTPRQILLQQILSYTTPVYAHIPLAINSQGKKLSKQNYARELTTGHESNNLWNALKWLQQNPPRELLDCTVEQIIIWGINHWDLAKIPPLSDGLVAPESL